MVSRNQQRTRKALLKEDTFPGCLWHLVYTVGFSISSWHVNTLWNQAIFSFTVLMVRVSIRTCFGGGHGWV